ncbi:MAG: tetratricopeptide repeat protein, partial [Vicinamibacteria bacterium]
SLELWFYESDRAAGLPPFFYLLFFRRNNIGEYRLYHPVVDGPPALIVGHPGWDNRMSLPLIDAVSKELARASLSLDPSDRGVYFRAEPSRGSDILFARIEDAPTRAVSADYLDAFLRYRNRVSADYSFNYFPNRALFAVLAGPEDTPFVHFSIEIDPQNFNLQTDEDEARYYTTADVSIEARKSGGELIVAKDRTIFLELSASQFQQARAFPLAFQDVFPLVPGEYDVSVVLKNRVLNQYTVAEQKIRVEPVSGGKPSIRDVVLGYESQIVAEGKGVVRPFRFEGLQLHPTAEAVFTIGDNVEVLTQLEGADGAHRLRIELLSGEELLLERETAVGQAPEGAVLTQISLLGIQGGRYTLQVELRGPAGELLARESTPLLVSPRTELVRAGLISRRGFNTAVPGVLALETGEQYLRLGEWERARKLLQKAADANNPDLPMAHWQLANVLLRLGEVDRSLEILIAMESLYPNQFEVVSGLGFGFYFKRSYEKARGYFERAMTLRPPHTTLLNALGDCHQRLGDAAKAKGAFERSLGLDPDQDAVKERLESLGGQP